jgi:cytochrome c oxidase cbb3-type subunit 3
MKTFASYFRLILFAIIAFLLFEYTIDSGNEWAFQKYPIIWAVIGVLLLFAIAIELAVEAVKSLLFRTLDADAKERYKQELAESSENSWLNRTYRKLKGGRPIEQEDEIIIDHDYDGIKELDNTLPPWWVYLFYITIIFGAVYLAKYHLFDGDSSAVEYEKEVAQAQLDIEEYKKTAKGLVDASTVEILTEESDLSAGQTIFTTNCVVCHKSDGGGGIGPNLTDEYWILGGGIKNVFNTISEGGRAGKGMISWKQDLSSLEIAQVASYVLGFQGTTPAEPKAPEGEKWVDETVPEEVGPGVETPVEGSEDTPVNEPVEETDSQQ